MLPPAGWMMLTTSLHGTVISKQTWSPAWTWWASANSFHPWLQELFCQLPMRIYICCHHLQTVSNSGHSARLLACSIEFCNSERDSLVIALRQEQRWSHSFFAMGKALILSLTGVESIWWAKNHQARKIIELGRQRQAINNPIPTTRRYTVNVTATIKLPMGQCIAWYLEHIFVAIFVPARSDAALPGLSRRRRWSELEVDVYAVWQLLLHNRVIQGQFVWGCPPTGRYLLHTRREHC